MFAVSPGDAGSAERPTLARSVWTDLGGGVWRCNPVLTEAVLPELRHPDHARRRLAALSVREIPPADSDQVESSLDVGIAESTPGDWGVGGLDGVAVATLVGDALSDPRSVDDATLTDRIIDAERLVRFAAGARAELVAEFARRRPGDESTLVCSDRVEPGSRWAPDELCLALDLTRLSAKALIGQSLQLATVLPDTLAALRNGQIDERRAEALCSATLQLPTELARRVEAIVLPAAPGRTLRQVRDRLYRAVHRVDPDGEYRRHKEAREDRRVSVQTRENGMATMWLYGPGTQVEASFTMLTRVAESLGADDPRTKDQRRFDLATQTLQGSLTITDLADVATAVAGTRTDDATTTPVPGDLDRDETDTGTASDSTGTGTARPDESGGSDGAGSGERRPDPHSDDPTAVDPKPADPEPGDPERPDPEAADPEPADSGPEGPERPGPNTVDPGSALVEAVIAALALRPQMHETVRKPLIQVVVGLDTLIGAGDHPADLVGHGPLTATTARALAADGVWKRLVTDPLSGALLDHGRTTYKPPAALADHVDARDQFCRFPTCSRRARDSDQDHLRRFEHDGITGDDNLNALCPSHHLLKEHRDWNVLAHPDGSLTWVTPTGHRHTSEPYDYRPFTEAPEADHEVTTGQDVATDTAGTTPADAPDDPPPF